MHQGGTEVNRFSIPLADPPSSPTVAKPGGQRRCRAHTCSQIVNRVARTPGWFRPVAFILLCGLTTAGATVPARGQGERRSRVPVLGKISGGTTRLAFSGRLQSFDLKRKLLKVETVEGGATEVFPVKKGMTASMAQGRKIKLQELPPGTSIIVYFEQKNDRRTVTEIVVLAASGGAEKKKAPPPS